MLNANLIFLLPSPDITSLTAEHPGYSAGKGGIKVRPYSKPVCWRTDSECAAQVKGQARKSSRVSEVICLVNHSPVSRRVCDAQEENMSGGASAGSIAASAYKHVGNEAPAVLAFTHVSVFHMHYSRHTAILPPSVPGKDWFHFLFIGFSSQLSLPSLLLLLLPFCRFSIKLRRTQR